MNIRAGRGSVGLTAGLSVVLVGILIGLTIVPGLTWAAPVTKWTFHAGDAFLASLNPKFSPAVAKAENGDTLAVMGTGTYNPGGPVSGGGLFWHNDSSGNPVHHGTWSAIAVLSYEDFGNGVANGFPRSFHGGILVLAVTITPTDISGVVLSGTLTVTCLIGDSVPAGVDEGITADVPGVIAFGESVSGNTLFVLTS
jgi:hypothetical protein